MTGGCSWAAGQTRRLQPRFALSGKLATIYGLLPRHASSVEVLFADGTRTAGNATAGVYTVEIGPGRLVAGHQPARLVAYAPRGRALQCTGLHGSSFVPTAQGDATAGDAADGGAPGRC